MFGNAYLAAESYRWLTLILLCKICTFIGENKKINGHSEGLILLNMQ